VFDASVDTVLKEVCLDIAKRYAILFLEIGTDKDHVPFLIQSIPTYSPTKIVKTIKSITAREVFKRIPAVKKQLWGGEFWSKGYFMSTIGRHGNETKSVFSKPCNYLTGSIRSRGEGVCLEYLGYHDARRFSESR